MELEILKSESAWRPITTETKDDHRKNTPIGQYHFKKQEFYEKSSKQSTVDIHLQ